ncbi:MULTISPECIES: OmpA family protein [Methylocaldum]|uniref:OmpA family protein n=1 Tax=unclassified Methylocaldum TaxID=2622260 RepID=UPI00098B75BB|nr:OmpA family protein [Methylocaldum sp. 14B]MDV3240243.1 OmpA family protein [Methylocaldum sp.]MVF23471.1 OmpA family protein [Methylocaldum sp. BRCS4]
MLKKILIALGIASVAATAVQAEEHFMDDRWYVAPFGTYFNPGGDRNAKDDWGAGLGIGKIINEYFNAEVRGFWQHLNGKGYNGDLTGGTVDLQYYFMRDVFSPYAVIGAGGMNTSAAGRSGASFIGEAGVGATYELHDNFLLRGDVRYRYVYEGNGGVYRNEDDFHDMVVNLGFVVPFGEKPRAVAEAEPTPAPADDCAARDSDRDGVNDCDDKCPGTMADSKVDDQGCPIRIELKGVNFKYNSDELTENAKSILDGVVEQLVASNEMRDIEVQGHASSEGSSQYNLKLSQRRAQSVADYLKSAGLKNRLYAKGYGEDYPIADNSTEAGREQNRRVQLVFMGE